MGAGELGLVAFVLFVLFGANKVGKKGQDEPEKEDNVAEAEKESSKKKDTQVTHRSA